MTPCRDAQSQRTSGHPHQETKGCTGGGVAARPRPPGRKPERQRTESYTGSHLAAAYFVRVSFGEIRYPQPFHGNFLVVVAPTEDIGETSGGTGISHSADVYAVDEQRGRKFVAFSCKPYQQADGAPPQSVSSSAGEIQPLWAAFGNLTRGESRE